MTVPESIQKGNERGFRHEATKSRIEKGLLWRRVKEQSVRVIDKEEDKLRVLFELHDESSHRGRDGTAKKVLERYWWRNVYRDAETYCRTCEQCQRQSKVRYQEELHPTFSTEVWQKVALDVVHMPKGVGSKKYLVVARCDFSGWPESRSLKKAKSEAIVEFLEEIFSRNGIPMILTGDGGAENKGLVDDLCEKLHLPK